MSVLLLKEPLENLCFFSFSDTGSAIRNIEDDVRDPRASADVDIRSLRSVRHHVFEQIGHDFFQQLSIDVNERNVLRNLNVDRSFTKEVARSLKGGSNDLFKRMPIRFQRDVSRLQTRHVKQVLNLEVEPDRFFVDRFRKLF